MRNRRSDTNWPQVGGLSRRRGERGSSVVELALALPILLLVALGIADFGRAFYFGIALANSARAGAAYASQSNAKTSDNTGIKQAAANEGQSIGLTTNNVATQQTCKCATTSPQPCGTTSWNCPTIVQPEVYVKVTTQDTFRTLVNYPGIPSPIIMTRSATLRVQ